MPEIKFSVADRERGAWHHFERDVPQPILDQSMQRRDAMSFLRAALDDDRIDGRAMIWEPTNGRAQGQ